MVDMILNRYEIMSKRAEGGMADLFLCKDTIDDTCSIVKVYNLDRLNGEGTHLHALDLASLEATRLHNLPQEAVNGFLLEQLMELARNEAKLLKKLSHPNLPVFQNYAGVDEHCYLFMSFIEGEDLDQRLHAGGDRPLPWDQVKVWMEGVLNALAYCHRQGILHLDIKPGNIIVQSQADGVDKAYLVDFGISCLLNAGRGTGLSGQTAGFSPPEQARTDGKVDERSDVYAAGATIYCLLTGRVPCPANEREKYDSLQRPSALAPWLTDSLERVILKAMSLKPSNRYASISELQIALGMNPPERWSPYVLPATSITPQLVVFLMDVSWSMNRALGIGKRIDAVQKALEKVLQRMLQRSLRGTTVASRYHLAMFAYSNQVTDLLGGILPIANIQAAPTLKLEEATNMHDGFEAVERLLLAVKDKYKEGPAPLVLHLTDGKYTGKDPAPVVDRIKKITFADGNVLVENAFIGDELLKEPVTDIYNWPGITADEQFNHNDMQVEKFARALFKMSSPLPSRYHEVLCQDWGFALDPDARMMLPASTPELIELCFTMAAATPIRPMD